MVSITIEPADNGVIKLTFDDSINGGGEEHLSRTVYDFDRDEENKDSIVDFLSELVLDLGIATGNDLDKYKVSINKEIGDPSLHDAESIKKTVKDLKSRIKDLESKIK